MLLVRLGLSVAFSLTTKRQQLSLSLPPLSPLFPSPIVVNFLVFPSARGLCSRKGRFVLEAQCFLPLLFVSSSCRWSFTAISC